MIQNQSTNATQARSNRACRCVPSARLLDAVRGATMMEVAFVIPFLFILIFGFIDIARYWQARAAVAQAAAEGANRMVVDPTLKKINSTDPTEQQQYSQMMANTKSYVESRAKNLMLQGNVDVSALIVPPSTVDEFKRIPVDVTVTANFNPMLPFLYHDVIQIHSTVSAFVEPLKTSAEPIPTDCYGRLFDSTNPPGAPPYNQGCPCEKGALSYSNSAGQCVCSGVTSSNGTAEQQDKSCGCPAGTEAIQAYDWSFMAGPWTPEAIQAANAASTICCPTGTPPSCPANQIRPSNPGGGQYSCDCTCGAGASPTGPGGACACNNQNQDYTPDPHGGSASCVCKLHSSDCPSPSSLNSTMCQCTCASPKVYDASTKTCICDSTAASSCTSGGGTPNGSTCACACPSNKQVSGSTCVCKAAEVAACQQSGGTMDPSTCQCGNCGQGIVQSNACACPNGGTISAGVCNCGSSKDWNAAAGSCACKASIVAACTAGGGQINPTDCSCSCGGNRVWNAATSTCDCNATLKFYCETNVFNYAGYPTGTYDNNTCTCNCPAHSTYMGNIICVCSGGNGTATGSSCNCASGQTYQGNSCMCDATAPAAKACTDSGGQLTASCGCSNCDGGKIVVNGVCVCGPGKTLQGGTCMCDTSTAAAQNCLASGGQPNEANNCACANCSGGRSIQANGLCGCTAPKVWNGSACDCDATQTANCQNSGGQMNGSCVCGSCAAGKIIVNGLCACPSGQTTQNGTCACDQSAGSATTCAAAGGQWTQNGQSCSCSCSGGRSYVNNACTCAAPKTNWDGTNCTCPTAANTACQTSGGQLNGSCTCGSCTLGRSIQANGLCGCTAPKTFTGSSCACDATQTTSCQNSGGQMNGSCTCGSCTLGRSVQANGLCGCPVGQFFSGAACVCDGSTPNAQACSGSNGQWTQNGSSCACNCTPAGKVLSGNACICGQGKIPSGNTCMCDQNTAAAQACLGSQGQLDSNCACYSCPSNRQLSNGTCVCNAQQKTDCQHSQGQYDNQACTCTCPTGTSMQGSSCSTCPGGQTVQNGACACPSGKTMQNGSCACATSTASDCTGAGGNLNPNDCTCSCPTGATMSGGHCTCQGFMELTSSGCVCPAYYQGYTTTQTSATSCSLACTGSRHEYNGWCILNTCKEGCSGGYTNQGGCPSCPNNG